MIYMFLADGFEETEALVTLDMLRRAGIDIETVGIGGEEITGAHKITVNADIADSEADEKVCSGVILPGGMPGTKNLLASPTVLNMLNACSDKGYPLCAICAAPMILGKMGFLIGKNAVCFPGFEKELRGATVLKDASVVDGNIVTARGAGAVFEFSHNIISLIKDSSIADRVIGDVQFAHKI